MTPQKFKDGWTNIEHPLSAMRPERLNRFHSSKSTFDFLTIAGLPAYCEPNLSFANDTNNEFYGIMPTITPGHFADYIVYFGYSFSF